MNGSELRAIRKRLGMSPSEFGIALYYTPRSAGHLVERKESGERRVTPQDIGLMIEMGWVDPKTDPFA